MTATRLRLPQRRYSHRDRDGYHPEVPSDGLTLDTPAGPVDLVAIERARTGRPTPVTRADIRHATALLPDGTAEHTEPLAAGLGITPDAVKRAVERHKANAATQEH
jgi:hypothetical protein